MLLFFATRGDAQNQGISNYWLMGYASWGGLPYGQTKFDFNTGILVSSFDSIEMDFKHTHANISDSMGNLLFYTNGNYIANTINDTMQNGAGLTPGAYANYAYDGFGIPQIALILKKPGGSSLFNLFHATVDNFPPTNSVYSYHIYSTTVDISMNGGLGAVISKNQPIINDTLITGKIVACKHSNGIDWWIIVLRANSNKIYKILYSSSGTFFSDQNIGVYKTFFGGQAKFSSDGKKFAVFNPQFTTTGMLEVFDFDRCSGTFSNADSIVFPPTYGFNCGLEFSPNSNLLYVTTGDSIFQFDVISPNIAASKTFVAAYDGFYQPGAPALQVGLSFPQLAPDGKIYITSGNSTSYMGTIENPDVAGIGCNVMQHSILLPAYSYNTLPNHPNYFLGCDTTQTTCPCLTTGIDYQDGEIKATAIPNPNNGVFTLHFAVQNKSGVLEVYDVMGNVVLKNYVAPWSQYKRVNIEDLPGGIYFCKLKWGNATGSIKVIKQ